MGKENERDLDKNKSKVRSKAMKKEMAKLQKEYKYDTKKFNKDS